MTKTVPTKGFPLSPTGKAFIHAGHYRIHAAVMAGHLRRFGENIFYKITEVNIENQRILKIQSET